jgi:hypothetical protein
VTRALVVLASALLVAATLTGYAWWALVDSGQFANRAGAALQDPAVRDTIADRVTDDLIVPARPELLAARPLVASVVSGTVGGDAFAALFRRGVRDMHAAVFRREQDTITLTLLDVAIVVAAAVRELDPRLAARFEDDERVDLVSRHAGAVTADALRFARAVRVLTLVLAALTLVAAGAALALSRDRRRTAAQLGIGVVVAGTAVVALEIGARLLVVDDPAAAAVWDAFLGDLRTAGWVLAGAGAVIVAAAGSLLRPIDVEAPLRAAWRLAGTQPAATPLRVVRGLALVAAGAILIAQPLAVLTIVVTLAGVYIVFKGVEALLRVTYRPPNEAASARARRPRRARPIAVVAASALLIGGAAVAFVAEADTDEPAAATTGCNGRPALCDRPLDQVTLPATHNSMSVPLPGWFASLQERPIAGQLEDGIRGLLLDTHYADRLGNGRTRTYFADSDDFRRAIQQDGVSDASVAAAKRVRSRLGFRGTGERGMYLCHTFCELGATPLSDVLDDVHEFLVTHPTEVLVVLNQDHVTPADFVAAVREAGLDRYALQPPRSAAPWPTLGELVRSNRRLLLLAENSAGEAPWYQLAYTRLMQESPFAFSRPADLIDPERVPASCRAHRGTSGAPLFLLNHWINTDPVPRPANAAAVNAFEPLLRRARTCERLRGRRVNLLAVDFYKRGDLFGVVDALNGS